MAYLASYKPGFLKDIKKLPIETRAKLLAAVDLIRCDPFSVAAKKLVGRSNLYRYRLGDYRLVYYVDTITHKIIFLLFAHRKEVYRRLGHLKKESS